MLERFFVYFTRFIVCTVMVGFVSLIISEAVAVHHVGFSPWMNAKALRTEQGWSEIQDEHPRVYTIGIGMYVAVTEDGQVYETNRSATPKLREILAQQAE